MLSLILLYINNSEFNSKYIENYHIFTSNLKIYYLKNRLRVIGLYLHHVIPLFCLP